MAPKGQKLKQFLSFGKKAIWILITCLIIAKFLSFFVFRLYTDTSLNDYPWKGEWASTQERFSSGVLFSNMLYAPPINKIQSSKMVLFEDFWTFRLPLKEQQIELTSTFSPYRRGNSEAVLGDSLGIQFFAKGAFSGGGEIEFTGTMDISRSTIAGSYRCTEPHDLGTFFLRRR